MFGPSEKTVKQFYDQILAKVSSKIVEELILANMFNVSPAAIAILTYWFQKDLPETIYVLPHKLWTGYQMRHLTALLIAINWYS